MFFYEISFPAPFLDVSQDLNIKLKLPNNTYCEPLTVSDAKTREDWPLWEKAIAEELESLHQHQTYELVDLPAHKRVIGSKFVFKIKRDSKGEVDRYKVRLVAKGFSQIEGINYFETTSPVAKLNSVRTLLSIVAIEDLEMTHMDVTAAFLIPELKEEVFMKLPLGLQEQQVWKLKKSLYGLKQASRAWNQEVEFFLLSLGFHSCKTDPCIFVKNSVDSKIIIGLYVDDLLIASTKLDDLIQIKLRLKSKWDIKEVSTSSSFLGLAIARDRLNRRIHLSQESLIADILVDCEMEKCNPAKIPYESGLKLCKSESEEPDEFQLDYRHTIGQLLYVAINTRPDITAAVSILSQYVSNPGPTHWQATKKLLRYLQGTSDFGIILGGGSLTLSGFTDADWAGDVDSRKSRTGYIFKLGDGPISWQSKKQPTVALSTTEAEYLSLSAGLQEALWLRQLLDELGYTQSRPTIMHQDNTGCIELTKSNKNHSRAKKKNQQAFQSRSVLEVCLLGC